MNIKENAWKEVGKNNCSHSENRVYVPRFNSFDSKGSWEFVPSNIPKEAQATIERNAWVSFYNEVEKRSKKQQQWLSENKYLMINSHLCICEN